MRQLSHAGSTLGSFVLGHIGAIVKVTLAADQTAADGGAARSGPTHGASLGKLEQFELVLVSFTLVARVLAQTQFGTRRTILVAAIHTRALVGKVVGTTGTTPLGG